ncbi:unnamed protein product, partial [Allacma fusca]
LYFSTVNFLTIYNNDSVYFAAFAHRLSQNYCRLIIKDFLAINS